MKFNIKDEDLFPGLEYDDFRVQPPKEWDLTTLFARLENGILFLHVEKKINSGIDDQVKKIEVN